MSEMSAETPDRYVTTDDELLELWRGLMGPWGFGYPSLWTIFIHADGLVERLIVPIDDIPERPDVELLDGIRHVFADSLDAGAGTSVAFLLSRPGRDHIGEGDREWARVLAASTDERLTRWPVHVATRGSIRRFAADDLIRSA